MRFLKATLLIGALSFVAVLVLDASHWLATAETMSATALNRMTSEGALVAVPRSLLYLTTLVIAFCFAWTTVDISRSAAKIGVGFGGIFLLLTGSVVTALYGTFFSPYQGILAIVFSGVLSLIYSRSRGGSRKRTLQRLFGSRISGKQFQQLVDSDIPLHLPGAEESATVVVCEVHNHVELMEALSAEDYVAMTNLYLRAASDYLVEVGGYLDECSGESLRVVFGAPLPREDHAVAACKAALELANRIDTLNKECDGRWHQRLDFRVGINSGPMVAAAYGGSRLGAFSVAGATVEFARRLCAACANYGCRILVGPETHSAAGEFVEARPIEMLRRANGRRIELYEILAPVNSLSPEQGRSREHFWKGVIYFREKRWDLALEEFSKARITGIPDSGLDNFVLRTERARRGEGASVQASSLAEIS